MPAYNHTHPGILLNKWYLVPLSLTVTETAKALKVSRKHLTDLLKGRAGISAEMALKLGKAFKTSPDFWMNLQKNYELSHALMKAKKITAGVTALYDRKAAS